MKKCQFCNKEALYDGKTRMGPWAFLCQDHFNQYGQGLGLGIGTILQKDEEKKEEV